MYNQDYKNTFSEDDKSREAYNNNALKYVSGFGYLHLDQKDEEKIGLRRATTGIGVAMLIFIFMMNIGSEFIVAGIFRLVSLNYDVLSSIFAWEDIIQIVLFIVTILLVIPAFFVGRKITGLTRAQALPNQKTTVGFVIKAAFVTLAVGVIGSYLTAWLSALSAAFFGTMPTMADDLAVPASILGKLLYISNMAVLPGICEEYAFRGVVMQSLRKYGDGFALIVSSFLFGIAHGNMVQAPNAFLAGLILGYFVLYTGNIKVSMFAHFLFNACSVIAGEMSDKMSYQNSQMFYAFVMLTYLIVGIISLIMLVIKNPDLFKLRVTNTVLTLREKFGIFLANPLTLIVLGNLILTTLSNYRVI